MPRIKLLDPICISKIAAGEVIERPASVVKELTENSIDAGATEIKITIKNGGKDLIEIKDNGFGIPQKDLPLAIKRHTTSKIDSEKDLDSINTMGFRGEAIYSIASVSRFSITSKTAKDELATSISVEGNVDKPKISETVTPSPGTQIQVRDLFFNFPVRRKFLKNRSIEEGYIYEVVAQYAIAHPGISFTFISDGEKEFQTLKGQNHLSIIKETLGRDIADSLLDIGIIQRDNVIIQGYLSKPSHHKRNRKYQYFYLNGRRIQSKFLQSALEEGFGPYLMKREYPIAFLFLELDPKYFDVNIHPQKREVLFYDENSLRTTISSSISYCLKTQDIVPRLTSTDRPKQTVLPVKDTKIPSSSIFSTKLGTSGKQEIALYPEIRTSELTIPLTNSEIQTIDDVIEPVEVIDLFGSELKFRGQLGDEFILLEDLSNHDLIILDFHATHERINLENLMNMHEKKEILSQTFLKPFRYSLPPGGRISLNDSLSFLNNLGFDFRIPKGKKNVVEVHAIPQILIKAELKPFLIELFEKRSDITIEDEMTEILSLIACHSSYRSGDTLSFQQTKKLLADLAQTKNPSICAHGRPTYVRITHQELLKMVKRK